jgi:hypothetical protein
MNLFCSGCGYFFQPRDKIYKEQIKDAVIPYRYSHKKCLPNGALVIDKGSLKHFADILEGRHQGLKKEEPLCEMCHKPFNKKYGWQKRCVECRGKAKKEYGEKYKIAKK